MADQTNFEAQAFTALGTERERVALPGAVFDGTINMPVMHQAVKAFLANQRQGNAATKIRKYVTGGNQKPWKQKGTGRARQGSTRAPHWVGGGTVFGPQPRAYDQYVPRQVRALARKSAFNARARDNAIVVIDRFSYERPQTKRLLNLVTRLGFDGRKVLILTDGVKPNVFLSGRNLPTVHVMPYSEVSTYHILWSDVVLIEGTAIGQELAPIAETEPTEAPRRERAPAPAKRAAKERTPKAERPSAKKAAAKKSAAKKSAAKKSPAKKATTTAAKKSASRKGDGPAKQSSTKKTTARKSAGKKKGK